MLRWGMPMNFARWVAEHQAELSPPVNAKTLYNDADMIVMAIGGPNRRTDYHVNQTGEWFFQVRGGMVLKVHDVATGQFHDVAIGEGDLFMLPAGVPHSPQRFADTVGIVVECRRRVGDVDAVRWYCDVAACRAIVYESRFHLADANGSNTLLGDALKPLIEAHYASEQQRTCPKCGHINVVPSAREHGMH